MALGVTLAVQQPIDNPVTRTKLNDLVATATGTVTGTLGTTQIENGAVTEPKIGTGAVTADKIGAGAVTAAKLAAGVMTAEALVSGSSAFRFVRSVEGAVKTDGQATTEVMTWQDVTGLAVTLTLKTSAAKVLIMGSVMLGGNYAGMRVLRGETVVAQGDALGLRTRAMGGTFGESGSTVPVMILDAPGDVGPHTYKVQLYHSNGTGSSCVNYDLTNTAARYTGVSSLVAMEICVIPD